MIDTKLVEYINSTSESAKRRSHEESFGMVESGWACIPLTEAVNNMAGLYDEARNSVLDEIMAMSDGKQVIISLEDLEAMKRGHDKWAGGANNGPTWHNDNKDGWRP